MFRHFAAISPYGDLSLQPPSSEGLVKGAVYLFRHSNLEVSGYDYHAYIKPFSEKLLLLQRDGRAFARGPLAFLQRYVSWVTDAHLGLVTEEGLSHSRKLGRAFRVRYKFWLQGRGDGVNDDLPRPLAHFYTDADARCRISAATFAKSFSGQTRDSHAATTDGDGLGECTSLVHLLHADGKKKSINNLNWHKALKIDQSVGGEEMKQLLSVVTAKPRKRLAPMWSSESPLTASDIYAMQLLHCYDLVSGRSSPWTSLFDTNDWEGFEYARDTKYFYSEGYGHSDTRLLAAPWLQAALDSANTPTAPFKYFGRPVVPLKVAFTHREEILYTACLLGLRFTPDWAPALERVDLERAWRVSQLAPYLGHIGIECFVGGRSEVCVRIVSNGKEVEAFSGHLIGLGGRPLYRLTDVQTWLAPRLAEYEAKFGAGLLTFMSNEEFGTQLP